MSGRGSAGHELAGQGSPGRRAEQGAAAEKRAGEIGRGASADGGFTDRLRAEIGAEAYERYIGRGAELELNGDGLCVRVASRFAADVIRRRFGDAMRRAMSAGSAGDALPIRFDVRPDRAGDGQGRGSSAGVAGGAAVGAEGERVERPRVPAVRPSRPAADGRTLESFVVGRANRLAFEAARRIAEGDAADITCPFFVHGSCGVGKTHLLAAIAQRFGELYAGSRVRFASAEAFTNEYIRAVRANKVEAFHRAYRKVDLLCLDDVHFLAKKSGTQTELLHTFDSLDLRGARVVIASDNHPRQIKPFSDALRSRFVSGSVARIDPPDGETRRRLILHFGSRSGLRFEGGAAEMLADCGMGDEPGGRCRCAT